MQVRSDSVIAIVEHNGAHVVAHSSRPGGQFLLAVDLPGAVGLPRHAQKTYHGAKDGWLEETVKANPFGRLIDPKEVARACAYLCSDESGLMTGANIDFDQYVAGTSDPPLEP